MSQMVRPEELVLLAAIAAVVRQGDVKDLAALSPALSQRLGERAYRSLLQGCGGLRALCRSHQLFDPADSDLHNPQLSAAAGQWNAAAVAVRFRPQEHRLLQAMAASVATCGPLNCTALAAELARQLGLDTYRQLLHGLSKLEVLCMRWGLFEVDEQRRNLVSPEAVQALLSQAVVEQESTEATMPDVSVPTAGGKRKKSGSEPENGDISEAMEQYPTLSTAEIQQAESMQPTATEVAQVVEQDEVHLRTLMLQQPALLASLSRLPDVQLANTELLLAADIVLHTSQVSHAITRWEGRKRGRKNAKRKSLASVA